MTGVDDEEVLHRHFIAVATGVYDDPEFASLPVRDEVEEFERWLCGADLGARAFKREDLAYEPTYEMIKDALIRPDSPWTPAHAVAVYVTGHGFKGREHMIALKGTVKRQSAATAMSTATMIEWLIQSDVDHLLVIIDLCYAGQALGPLLDSDVEWKPTWLLLASATRGQAAGVGVLARAVREFLADARTNPKFNHGPYFVASEFVAAIEEHLPPDQRIAPLQARFASRGESLCLPNPDWKPGPDVGPAIRLADLSAHWSPRSRGVARDADPGWFFTGRPDVMRRVLDFTRGDPGTLLVTGRAGTGKSAVLSRLVTLADAGFVGRYATQVAAVPPALRPQVGSVDAAVLATRKLTIQVLDQICTAVGVRRPDDAAGIPDVLELLEAWWAWLRTHDRLMTVVVDALEEADNPRAVVEEVLSRLDPPGAPRRVRLLVGVRSPGGDIGGAIADTTQAVLGAERVRLDERPLVDEDDVAAFAREVLVAAAGSPYRTADDQAVDRVVARIAARADASYLFAGTAAASLARRQEIVDPDDARWLAVLDDHVVGIVRDDIARTAGTPPDRERAVHLLRAVAFGQGAGVPWYRVWAEVATAIAVNTTYGDRDIESLLALPLAGYLTTDQEDGITTYRIADDTVRQALRDRPWVLVGQEVPSQREPIAEVEARIATVLKPERRWSRTGTGVPLPEYVRRHLVEHAAAGGALDRETVPDWFLPYAEPTRLRQADPTATGLPLSSAVRRVAHRWDWHRPRFNAAALRMFSALYGAPLDKAVFDDDWTVPWASSSRDMSEILGSHPAVTKVAAIGSADGRVVAVTGGADGLRVWDLAGGTRVAEPVANVVGSISALAVVTPPGSEPVAIAVSDAAGVWVVDLMSTPLHGRLAIADPGAICALGAAVLADGRTVVVTGSRQGRFASWDLATGARIGEAVERHSGPVNAIATVTAGADGSVTAVTVGDDGTVRTWDPRTAGAVGGPMVGHDGPVSAVSATTIGGRPVAVTGGRDETVRIWDLIDRGERGSALSGHAGTVWAVSTTTLPDGRACAVTCAEDPTVRVWDLAAQALHDESMISHGRPVAALAAIRLPQTGPTVITGGRDGTIRSWNLTEQPVAGIVAARERDRVSSIAVGIHPDGSAFAVTGSDADDATLWSLADSMHTRVSMAGHRKPVVAVRTAVRSDGTVVVVTASWDATLRVWDSLDATQVGGPLHGHRGPVLALDTVMTVDGRLVAVSGGMDGTVRFWDLECVSAIASSPAADTWITSVAATCLPDGRPIAVTGTRDGRLRAWDVERHEPLGESVRGHQGGVRALATAVVQGRAVVVSGGRDGAVRMWDPLRMAPVGRRMTGHVGQVAAVAAGVLGDGRAVALTGGDDAAVRVWDLSANVQIGVELPTPTAVRALAVDAGRPGFRIVMAGNGFLAVADRR
ncbi:MAG TPA: hypothetical protein VGZ32_19195 [Actinocrinis sp.]|jgi:WD40 repeat protein|uniref:hypothetical protein n=1 Tax=Actinocrinis sp. TaxID=1920516 RepID=UPI002DDD6A10|nr:hypothetical protein [Actinocrinis sp.]HEV3172480.1 hypothetical protein [Actinocrinis sp.]